MVSYRAALLLLSCAVLNESASGRKLQASSCNFDTVFSLRSEWGSVDDACHKKLPFELWTLMKADGSAQSADALHVRENCIQTSKVGLLELITPKGYTMSESIEAAPGDVVSETEHATTYQGATAATFEAFCKDDDITRVTRVSAHLEAHRPIKRNPGRRLQSTTSEAGQAHEVAELITGLADLGCTRTTGEDQTVCVMSDSFNRLGYAETLQALGDLPLVEVVKELPLTDDAEPKDEGSAMLEIMYDIAPGATYKFNTAFMGEQTFADDITVLANEEMCDIIVDDVGIFESPTYRDGVIANALNEAVDTGGLYFTATGNSGYGYKFPSNFECAMGFETYFNETPACGTGVASHVFQPEETGDLRYMYPLAAELDVEVFLLHWDSGIGTTEDVWIALWLEFIPTGEMFFAFVGDIMQGGKAYEQLAFNTILLDDGETLDPDVGYYAQIIHLGEEVGDLETEFFLINPSRAIDGQSDEAIYGHKCASNALSVAAMEWVEGDGPGGAFEDPETSSVEYFSSRGPCIVNGEVRAKPDTTAADGVTTSTPGFAPFYGTSAAAPVAGAIASIVRAACYPKVVGHAEMMDMLTNYDYTIDLTSDADGAAETWGRDGGHGIISADQMLAWVAANCGNACPGASSPPTTDEPVVPTAEPTDNTPVPPTGDTPAPAAPITPTPSPVAPRTPAPVETEEPETSTGDTPAPVEPIMTTPSPFAPRTRAPVETGEPETPTGGTPAPVTATITTPSPVAPRTTAPVEKEEPEPPAPEDSEDVYVEAGTKTTVSVTATAYDERPGSDSGENGCGDDGCLPELAHDGVGEEDIESRWSCSKEIVPDGGQCEIEFTFGSPQDIVDVEVDYWKGDQRTRTLKVKLDGHIMGKFESHPGSISASLGIKQDGVKTVVLQSVGIDEDEWISLLEVRLMVEP